MAMEPALKQRLVGAIFLVALGVIFIPMLLDQDADPRLDISMQIPERPVYEPIDALDQPLPAMPAFPDVDMQQLPEAPELPVGTLEKPASGAKVSPLPSDSGHTGLSQSQVSSLDKSRLSASQSDQSNTDSTTSAAQIDEVLAKASSKSPSKAVEPEAQKVSPQQAVPLITQPAVVEKSVPSNTQGFVVQLGSFTSQDNAQRMVNTLSKKGYKVFIESSMGSAGTVYRVRVGPFTDRVKAEAIQATLARQEKRRGMVLVYP